MTEEAETLARRVVERVQEVYSPAYRLRMQREEPESLLGLVERLRLALEEGVPEEPESRMIVPKPPACTFQARGQ